MSGDTSQPAPTKQARPLPLVTIAFCTQCRWMLRAAYFAQELLSTFGVALGEVALQPVTGGVFRASVEWEVDEAVASTSDLPRFYEASQVEGVDKPSVEEQLSDSRKRRRIVLLWDRKAEAGFPATKVLKQRVRDCVEPGRGLGHSDVGGKANSAVAEATTAVAATTEKKEEDDKPTQKQEAAKGGRDDCETCP